MNTTERTEPHVALVESMTRVVEAGQRLMVDRLDLLRVEVGEVAGRTVRAALLMVAGALLFGVAYLFLLAGAVAWLQQYLALPASLAAAAAATACLGTAALGLARYEQGGGDATDLVPDPDDAATP